MPEATKTITERIFHACLYEIVALLLCTPLFAWLTGTALHTMGALNLAISLIALGWNMVFNAIYEALLRRFQREKTPGMRLLHGIGFEGGLGLMVVPLAAWWLDISLWAAFWLDAGILLFFLPYTVAFNWCYDLGRARYWRSRQGQRDQ